MKPFHSRTKIVATLGPASSESEVLYNMFNAGLDVCRLNFSHGSHADHQKSIDIINELNKKYHYNVGILADLQGPKIRIGAVKEGGVHLINDAKIVITTQECVGNEERIPITYSEFPKDVKDGEIILLDDGKLQMRVLETNYKDEVTCLVIHGGCLTSKKGVNLPNTKVSIPSLTEEDKQNLLFVLKNDVQWIGLSFVRQAADIIELKEIIKAEGKNAKVVAKIEKPEAVANIDEIITVSDAIMVARGDLGVEMPMEEVPLLQKMIVAKCREASKPVIIATQMLESMITTPRPTRAEVNDVANSVLDGADAVMLSGETSVGEFPLIVIETMQKIISNIEANNYPFHAKKLLKPDAPTFLGDAVCDSSCLMAKQTGAIGIVSMTSSGYTAFELSSHRPQAPIFIFTGNRNILNTLSLVWGVRGFYYDKFESTDKTFADVNNFLKKQKLIKKGDIIINTASIPMETKGRTNMLKVTVVD